MGAPVNVPPRSDAQPDDGDGAVDLTPALDVARSFLRAARRRWILTAAVLVLGALATASAALVAPRSYTIDAKILAQRQVPIPMLGGAPRAEPTEILDAPARIARETRSASEIILRRDNLVAIVRATNLAERWELGRSPIQRLSATLGRPVPVEERERALVGVLEKKIAVKADETTITISLNWHHPEVGHQLLSCVLRNFLKDKGEVETAATTEAITILEGQAARQREAIDVALGAAEEAQRSVVSAEANDRRRLRAEARAINAGDVRMETELADKRRAVQSAEDARQRQITDLRVQLDQLRLTYAPGHPMVLAMEERLRHARAEPAELTRLKREQEAILARLRGFGTRAEAASATPEQPKLDAARIKLASAVNKYEELTGRIDAARLELHAAQATFKHRYVVAEPPEVPGQSDKPVALILALVGALFTAAAALSAAGLRERARGRFVDASQVRRRLPIPLLAEVEEPR